MNDYFYKSPDRCIYVSGYESLNRRMRWAPIIKEIMRFKQEGTILGIECAYGFFLKFLPNSFENVIDLKGTVEMVHNLLKKGGYFIASFPVHQSYFIIAQNEQ